MPRISRCGPENRNVRRESKLSVPDRNIMPAISTTSGTDYTNVHIHKDPSYRRNQEISPAMV